MMKTMVKEEAFGEVTICVFDESITFVCSPIKLDATYDINTKKITGMGSRACEDYILREVKEILNK